MPNDVGENLTLSRTRKHAFPYPIILGYIQNNKTVKTHKIARILAMPIHSFIHSFIYSHYPRVQLPAASHYVLLLLSVFYFLCRVFQLASLVLSSSAFYSMV